MTKTDIQRKCVTARVIQQFFTEHSFTAQTKDYNQLMRAELWLTANDGSRTLMNAHGLKQKKVKNVNTIPFLQGLLSTCCRDGIQRSSKRHSFPFLINCRHPWLHPLRSSISIHQRRISTDQAFTLVWIIVYHSKLSLILKRSAKVCCCLVCDVIRMWFKSIGD